MLQLTLGLPFAQWPVPSTPSFTVVKAAPVTGVFAEATVVIPNRSMNTTILPVNNLNFVFIFFQPFIDMFVIIRLCIMNQTGIYSIGTSLESLDTPNQIVAELRYKASLQARLTIL